MTKTSKSKKENKKESFEISIYKNIDEIIDKYLKEFDTEEQIDIINVIKKKLHVISPMKNEPVDCVLWVKNDYVHANDYNPNSVAPPEMELLSISISEDGYTQPIVTMPDSDETFEVIDGFHRNRVGKENEEIKKRIYGYLPIVFINSDRIDKADRIASTIRHNRARGKHQVDSMSDIVADLRKRNWSPDKIGRELGMDKDEVLRLSQISGLIELFQNSEFTQAWEAEDFMEDEIIE